MNFSDAIKFFNSFGWNRGTVTFEYNEKQWVCRIECPKDCLIGKKHISIINSGASYSTPQEAYYMCIKKTENNIAKNVKAYQIVHIKGYQGRYCRVEIENSGEFPSSNLYVFKSLDTGKQIFVDGNTTVEF